MAQARMNSKISALKREIREEAKSETESVASPPSRGAAFKRSPTSRLSPGGSDDATESLVAGLKKRVGTLESDLKRRQEAYL